jgi:hypothetical protein
MVTVSSLLMQSRGGEERKVRGRERRCVYVCVLGGCNCVSVRVCSYNKHSLCVEPDIPWSSKSTRLHIETIFGLSTP